MQNAIEVHRSSVQTWECDHMGHMNVQLYVDKATQGLACLALALGLPPRALGERGLALATDEVHIRFWREQRAGAPFHILAGVLGIEGDRLRVYQEMRATVGDEVAATFVGQHRLIDASTREPASLPEAVVARSRDLLVALPEHGAPRGLAPHPPRPRPDLDEARRLGMPATYRAPVGDAQCDAHGFMTARHYMGAVSDSIPHLMLRLAGIDRSAASTVGGAAVEYRFVYHAAPRAGDLLELHSGLAAVGAKTYTFCHWLFDLESGRAVATAEAIAVVFDLEARRAIAIPDDLRRHLEGLVIPGLSL